MSEKKSLHICHLYYDILNLYGDNGNIRTMEKRLAWRGIDSKVTKLSFGEVDTTQDYDIIFIGGRGRQHRSAAGDAGMASQDAS